MVKNNCLECKRILKRNSLCACLNKKVSKKGKCDVNEKI